MKFAIACLLALATVFTAQAISQYTTKYDNIDLDEILNSDRLLGNYVNCLMEIGNCTPDGKELKEILPDALENGCLKCSEKQRNGSEKIIRFLVNKRPELWDKLATKYDTDGKYRIKYQDQATEIGINY